MKFDTTIKTGMALLIAVLAALTTALTQYGAVSAIDTQTWLIVIGTVLASGALVAFVTNVPGVAGGIIKAVVGASGAAISALVPALDDHVLSQLDIITALSAFVVALSVVYEVPEPPAPAPTTPTTVTRGG